MLSIRTFGSLRIEADGEEMSLPASRKTRALLGYLLLSRTAQTRSRLCELFWEIPDDPRAALRWSLSKLRAAVNGAGRIRLLADRDRVEIDKSDVHLDFGSVCACAEDGFAPANDLADAWECASETLMQDCDLPNQHDYSAWLEQQRNEVTRVRTKLARRLALTSELLPEDQDRWAERWLSAAPYDPDAARQAVGARRNRGLETEGLEVQIATSFLEAGLAPPDLSVDSPPPAAPSRTDHSPPAGPAPRQAIRFVQARDGTSIAWASVGRKENPPLLKAANWLSHLELDWEAPIWSPLFRELAQSFHFVRYDERGCGLSDWDVDRIEFEEFVTDLELVADAAGFERFPLLGISQGAAVSIEFAARHPDRVSHLILFGGYEAGWRHVASPDEIREREAVMVLTETGWGRDNPSYRQIFSRTFMPDATPAELEWFDEFQRRTTSPENAVRFQKAFAEIDVRDRLKDVEAPTLVVHSRNDVRTPVSFGHSLAAGIANAEFVGIDSNNHLLLGREPASQEFLAAVRRFLSE